MMYGSALEPSAKSDTFPFQITFLHSKAGLHPGLRLGPIFIVFLILPPCPMATRRVRERIANRLFDVFETHGDLVKF